LILITGAVALTIIGLMRVGGLEHLRTMVPPDYFHMIKPVTDSNFPWTGIFFGAPILGIWLLVHRSSDRPARAFCPRRRPR
jgi:SSS family solute:Na+ symporter